MELVVDRSVLRQEVMRSFFIVLAEVLLLRYLFLLLSYDLATRS
jgi:preprotein translocase subunit SecE